MAFGQINSDQFDVFLRDLSKDPQPDRHSCFVARNFLLDENVLSSRQNSYQASGGMAKHGTFGEWDAKHKVYIEKHVALTRRPNTSLPKHLDPKKTTQCPETFRSLDQYPVLSGVDENLDLIRVEPLGSIAKTNKEPETTVIDIMQKCIEDPSSDQGPILDAFLETWMKERDLRPVWAGFWEDVADLFGDTPAEDQQGWPDRLRSRLGLLHLDPQQRGLQSIAIVAFRYPVKALPTLRGRRDERPLAVPTVLDGRFNSAFCPVPANQPWGRIVDLEASVNEPLRELLHPAIELRAKHVFRVGSITNGITQDQSYARALHLMMLRDLASRPDYAGLTDPEN